MKKSKQKMKQTDINQQLHNIIENDTTGIDNEQLYTIDKTGHQSISDHITVDQSTSNKNKLNKLYKQIQHKLSKNNTNKKNKNTKSTADDVYDVWSTPLPAVIPHTNTTGFIDTPVLQSQLNYRTAAQRNAINHGITKSVLINEINSGTSYNPDEYKRQLLLQHTNQLLLQQAKHELLLDQLKSYDTTKYEKHDVSESDDDNWMNDDNSTAVNKKQKKTKTQQHKRRQLLHRQRLQLEVQLANKKLYNKQLQQLPFITAELQQSLELQQKLHEKKSELRSQLNNHPRLGKRIIDPSIPNIPLSDELHDTRSMRLMKPALGIVKNLVQNYEARHIIEPHRRFDDKIYHSKKRNNKYLMKNRKLHVLPNGMTDQ